MKILQKTLLSLLLLSPWTAQAVIQASETPVSVKTIRINLYETEDGNTRIKTLSCNASFPGFRDAVIQRADGRNWLVFPEETPCLISFLRKNVNVIPPVSPVPRLPIDIIPPQPSPKPIITLDQ